MQNWENDPFDRSSLRPVRKDALPSQNDPSKPDKRQDGSSVSQQSQSGRQLLPGIQLPKGGGAIRGIDEKFKVNAANGTSSFSIPLPLSPSRGGYKPPISLVYNSGNGNSPFGLGWSLTVPSIMRRTRNYLPKYEDAWESDIFQLSDTEDLVPLLIESGGNWIRQVQSRTVDSINYSIAQYRPRIESNFARIERWTDTSTGDAHWRVLSPDNSTSYYGLTSESRVSDPQNPGRVFQWLLSQAHDDKGNLVLLNYKTEDGAGVPASLCEKNKSGKCTQVYLSSVWYGNIKPWFEGDNLPDEEQFLFRAIFDFGERDNAQPVPGDIYQEIQPWTCRKDSFSSFRSGFDIRTYRRCSRVLMFHCLPQQELPRNPCLVKSLDLFYDDDLTLLRNGDEVPGFSFLVKATQKGYIWDPTTQTYGSKSLPDMDFTYQQHIWNTQVQDVTPGNRAGVPAGVDQTSYRWVDLFSEGITGILTEQGNAWYYKSNLGEGAFSNAEQVALLPSYRGLTTQDISIRELEGNGEKYLVQEKMRPQTFFKLSPGNEWCKGRLFEQYPTVDLEDRNARMLDLNEDGIEEILYTEEYQFLWYEGLGERGFRLAGTVPKTFDEEQGPAIIFADKDQSIFLADMTGDGLLDIVRIRNGELCYWPNKGYACYGAKVGMDNAPVFDTPDGFDPSFLRLADVDGSGMADIIYLGREGFLVWMNLNGNAWSPAPEVISPFPAIANDTTIDILDFLGTGTACIVCSSPISAEPFRYIDLMGSRKPCLLTGYQNNCGKEVSIEYASSTSYYLADKEAGIPWITKLPFPVQCIAKVTSSDLVRASVLTCTYSYRHGFYDPYDKEFRGFGFAEQQDTETFEQFVINAGSEKEQDVDQPPVTTRSWFHTGAFLWGRDLVNLLSQEYFKNTAFAEYAMPDPILPQGMDPDDLHEAYRACKGMLLRSEVYSADGTPQQDMPYSATQSNAQVIPLQPKGPNRYASFLVVASESITYSYERVSADPRISHSFVLATDQYGNVIKGAAIVYPRVKRPTGTAAIPDLVWDQQNQLHISTGETDYTNDILLPDTYRLRVPCESRAYEIAGLTLPAGLYFTLGALATAIAGIPTISYDQDFSGGVQQRLFRHSRIYFANDSLLSSPLPLGQLSSLAIAYKSFALAFTAGLVTKYYGGKVANALLTAAMYTHSEGDADWWSQPGVLLYSATPANDFYIPTGSQDVFGHTSTIQYDSYFLLPVSSMDALSNTTSVSNDYRILSPTLLTDANLNQTAVQADELGMVVALALMGKEGSGDGDTLADPTIKADYDVLNWQLSGQPNYVHVQAREIHGPSNPGWVESFVYSDGGGTVIMTKAPAAPGMAAQWDPATHSVKEVFANPRWIGNGRTILNNKGNPVKQYEPYFSVSSGYETESALVETGFTPILYYDPLGRNTRTDLPNGTFTTVEFDGWMNVRYDANDTVMDSTWYSGLGSPDPLGPEPSDPSQRAAWLAAKNYLTPATVHTNALGNNFYSVVDYGGGVTSATYVLSDFTGRYSNSFDQLSRNIAQAYTNLLGQTIYAVTAEKGQRWIFTDVMGRMVNIWDNAVNVLGASYDDLNRTVGLLLTTGAVTQVIGYFIYGETLPVATGQARNLRGRLLQMYDQSGAIAVSDIDFKGNVLAASRTLCKDYQDTADWSTLVGLTNISAIDAAAALLLETESFDSTMTVDALNRPVTITQPAGTIITPQYDAGSNLASLVANIMGAATSTTFLVSQQYNSRGQRLNAQYGNNTTVNYSYDPETFRLTNITTLQHPADPASQSLQDLNYYFDPVGNITQVEDEAQQTRYFKNAVVSPGNKFTYDALYQLVSATGREHAGLGMDMQPNNSDIPSFSPIPEVNDINAVRNYTEYYMYDLCRNLMSMQHVATGASWTQRYQYQYQLNPADNTNRLAAISLPGDAPGTFSGQFAYNAGDDAGLHGNMTSMPNLSAPGSLVWNFMDQLSSVNLGGGGMAYYQYGLGVGRVRKVIQRQGGLIQERIYLGALEIYRERQGNNPPTLERYTLRIADTEGFFAQVDTKTVDVNGSDPGNALDVPNIRFQYTNHLGSAVLETDVSGNILSYEEYHPFGTSSYRVGQAGYDISAKRYRFSGKERDEETGFYYFGARYYAAWLGRWTSSDPAGFAGGLNVFAYCTNNPIILRDPDGQKDIGYNTKDVGVDKMTDPAEVSKTLREEGFDFTGFDKKGQPMAPDTEGHGVGNVKKNATGWDVGKWLKVPPPPEEVTARPPSAGDDSKVATPGPGNAPETQPVPPAITADKAPDNAGGGNGASQVPSNDAYTGRELLQRGVAPTSTTGELPEGTLHLWSGDPAKAEAVNAIKSEGTGWMMGKIGMTNSSPGAPTWEHQAAEDLYKATMARNGGAALTKAEMDSIWGWPSANVVGRGAFSGYPVQGHGPTSTTFRERGYIQGAFENRARAIGGGLGGGLGIASGLWSATHAQQYNNVGVQIGVTVAGVGEATGGIIYGSGAILGATDAMAIGAGMMRFGGGAGAAIASTYMAVEEFKAGDNVAGVVDSLGAVGGVLMVCAALGPAGWAVAGTIGLGLLAFSAGFHIGRWLAGR
jgi:RHS repeat-associated protein